MTPTFVIIDGSSLVHRAFYALPLLHTAKGQYTNAVYGFTMMLVKLLDEVKPERIAVAFDKSRVTFRTELFPDYKAQRKPTPGELSEQFPLIKEVLQAYGIFTIEAAGYEADDIIGTMARQAAEDGHEVVIVTGDRDALQLIEPSTRVMLTKKGISDLELMDVAAFERQYGLSPLQMIDLKGLMGDTSDNIPGVPGVGEKTALKLITEYGSVEAVLENVDRVAGRKLQENLRNHQELALLSKQLATIDRHMPLVFAADSYAYTPDAKRLRELFVQFEFKTLVAKLPELFPDQADRTEPVMKTAAELLPEIELSGDCVELIGRIRAQGEWCFYPVAAGKTPDLVLAGLAVYVDGKAVYVEAQAAGWEELLTLFADSDVRKVTYDAKWMAKLAQSPAGSAGGLYFDVMLAAYLLEPTTAEYSLVELCGKYLSIAAEASVVQGWEEQTYACWAASVVHGLFSVLPERLRDGELERLFFAVEMPLTTVLAAMESYGITVDLPNLQRMSEDIAGKVDKLLTEIYQLAGEEFNVNSTKQLGAILFEKLKLPVGKKTKTGYSTDAEVLEKLSGQHPLIDCLLEYRMLTKLKSTYLDGMAGLVNPVTQRVYTTFHQTVTATGRLSSSDPNLQNIPIRTETGRRIRELFVPGAGYQLLMSADYSQIELRILAHMSGDANLKEAFQQNQDIHTRTAAEVFGVPMAAVSAEMRGRAKAVNFGIVYGISDYGLSRDIGVSRKEAGQYIDSYFANYHGVKSFLERVVQEAREEGYVTTLLGRRRYLPEINSTHFNQRAFAERTAMNTPIQGTAADIIKQAMLDVHAVLTGQGLRSRVLLQVHDELVLEVVEEELETVSRLVKAAMEQAVPLSVPMVVDIKTGSNWAQAK